MLENPVEKSASQHVSHSPEPSLDPYVCKMERFELFSTNQCYYLVGGNKANSAFRILKMDRTLIERPQTEHSIKYPPNNQAVSRSHSDLNYTPTQESESTIADNSHAPKPSLRPLSDFLTEDPNVYTQEEIRDMLDMIHDGNRMKSSNGNNADGSSSGGDGLKPLVKAYGIVGFVRFLDCYYLTLITRRAKVGSIGGSAIYTIKNTETIPLKPAERSPIYGIDDHADPSSVLLSMWNRGKRSVGLGLTNREIAELRYQGLYQVMDLSKGFFLSYAYDLTRSLQENFLLAVAKPYPPPSFKEMYAWNYFLTREFEACLSSATSFYWLNPIIHGSYVQRRVNDYGRTLDIILLARRSRHFAGTRYLKRGVSEQGKVANDVEHEQIIHDDTKAPPGIFCSYLQNRGSIPTYWTQESSVTMPKPPIELNRVDPTYNATRLHFEDMIRRYSSPILVLDLVKQSEKREREVRVGNEFRHAIDYINTTIEDVHKIRYCALDYSHISKHRNLDVSSSLNEASVWAVNQTGFFCSSPKWKIVERGIVTPFTEEDGNGSACLTEKLGIYFFPMEQNGVLRTNCIDCLDRTNVAQFSAGVEAISQQLVVMGIRSRTRLNPTSTIVRVLIDMYVEIGDNIALQYGGSEAHKKVTADRTESNVTGPMGKHKELLTSIRRYYSNAFTDRLKQDAMNLFLGYYVPYRHSVPLWEMENDYYLHNFHVKSGRGMSCTMHEYRNLFGIGWHEADNESAAPSSSMLTKSTLVRRAYTEKPSCAYYRGESGRVQRVRSRCETQKEILSVWWKHALQGHIQQRMSMQVGKNKADMTLWGRYERLYQPDSLSQFDKYFSRGWSTPVRRSHAAQHAEEDEEHGADLLRRIMSGFSSNEVPMNEKRGVFPKISTMALGDFTRLHGYGSFSESSLRRFVEFHSKLDSSFHDHYADSNLGIGTVSPRDEYVRYLSPCVDMAPPPQTHDDNKIKEFKDCLTDYSLSADDVNGIQKLSVKSHLCEIIQHGPYKGLTKEDSAIDVATAIQEQFNALDSISMATGGQRLVERELRRRGLFKEGVKEYVSDCLRHFASSEKQYSEILDASKTSCRRSDLTTADSFKLYASEFDSTSKLSISNQMFLMGRKPEGIDKAALDEQVVGKSGKPTASSFVNKAARLGIYIAPHSELQKSVISPLYPCERRLVPPEGFEQINDDMFARKDNKFMVFNGASLNNWNGVRPITKISCADDVLNIIQ